MTSKAHQIVLTNVPIFLREFLKSKHTLSTHRAYNQCGEYPACHKNGIYRFNKVIHEQPPNIVGSQLSFSPIKN